MSWVRVEDTFWQHPKFLSLSEDAVALWLRALAYTNASKTDGLVPRAALPLLSRSKRPAKAAQELVEARLWDATDDGWQVHDWSDYQASRAQREQATRDKSRRQQEWRERQDRNVSPRRDVDASTRTPRDAAPIPSHPIPSQGREEISEPPPPLLPPESRAREPVAAAGVPENRAIAEVLGSLGASPTLRGLARAEFAARLAAHSNSDGFTGKHTLSDVLESVSQASSRAADLEAGGDPLPDTKLIPLVVGFVRSGPRRPGRHQARPVQPLVERRQDGMTRADEPLEANDDHPF